MSMWRSWNMAPLYLAVVVVLLGGGLWTSWFAGYMLGASIAGGLLAGVLLSTARMMQRPTPVAALVVLALCLVVLALMGFVALRVLLVGLIVASLLSAAWYVIWDVWITRSVNAEVPSKVVAVGGTGTAGRALIVQHPGRSGFHSTLERALADSLMSQGWHVDMTTPSSVTPLELSPYGLLVLGAPVYNWRAAMPLLAYIERLGTLQGLPVALVLSGGGITGEAMADLNRRVVDAGGDIVESVEVWTERPNEPRHGLSDPEAIMRRAGAVITTNARSRRGELTPGDLDAMLTDALEQTFPASDPVSLRFDSPRRRGRSISAAR